MNKARIYRMYFQHYDCLERVCVAHSGSHQFIATAFGRGGYRLILFVRGTHP